MQTDDGLLISSRRAPKACMVTWNTRSLRRRSLATFIRPIRWNRQRTSFWFWSEACPSPDFQASGYVNKVVPLVAGTNDFELAIELEPAADIAGTVLRPDGNPASGAKVFFRGEHFRFRVGEDCFVSTPEYPFAVTTRAGVDGAFRIPKIDGIERLEVVHPEGWANVDLSDLAAIVRLQPWGRVSGVVRSGQNILPGVEVRATERGEKPEQMLFDYITKTDSDGNFEFSKVPGGRAAIFVPLENSPTMISGVREIQVKPGETASVPLSVETRLDAEGKKRPT